MQSNSSFDKQFWLQLTNSYENQIKAKLHESDSWLRSLVLQVLLIAVRIMGRNLFFILRFRYNSLNYFLFNLDKLRLLHTWLADTYSQTLLIKVVVRRILGQAYLQPLIDENEETMRFSRAKSLILEASTRIINMGSTDFHLNYYDLTTIGYPLKLHIHEMNVVWTFMSEQYHYQHGDIDLGVKQDDIVIDGGGCWGDTALYFASKNAKAVYSFEFTKENLQIFHNNLAGNASNSQVISIIESALWNEDDITLNFKNAGPATSVVLNRALEETVVTITIDTFVEREHIERIDFIKMDIEGAELKALEGARRTIERFAPHLAITVYHKQEDLCTIPQYLKSLCPDYEFYIDHFTTTMMETVLFARRKQSDGEVRFGVATRQESVVNNGN